MDYYGAEASLAVLGMLGVHRLDGSTPVRWRPTRLLRRCPRGRRHGLAHILLLRPAAPPPLESARPPAWSDAAARPRTVQERHHRHLHMRVYQLDHLTKVC